eukprot:jgi/Picre1/29865/NNA_005247.t1
MAAEVAAAKRERDFYLSRVDKAKAVEAIIERQQQEDVDATQLMNTTTNSNEEEKKKQQKGTAQVNMLLTRLVANGCSTIRPVGNDKKSTRLHSKTPILGVFIRHSIDSISSDRRRVACEASLGPPWDLNAFKNWTAIGQFESNSETIQTISRFEHFYYTISVTYWAILLASILSGNTVLTRLAQFKVFVSLMCIASFAFASWFLARCIKDVQNHTESITVDKDLSGLYRYGWRALFWLGFVLFYAAPTASAPVTDLLAIPGAVMCLYGWHWLLHLLLLLDMVVHGRPERSSPFNHGWAVCLVASSPGSGEYSVCDWVCRSGGALWSVVAFCASFILYSRYIIPLEEEMLTEAFPSSYVHYKERVPAFSGALMLLLVIQAALFWRFGLVP